MNKIFYASKYKSNYIILFLSILGLILSYFINSYILLGTLIINTIIFKGLVNKEIIVFNKDKLYLIENGNRSFILGFIGLILLFYAFYLCSSRYYFEGLLLVLLFYIVIAIYNIISILLMDRFVKKNNLYDLDNNKYRVYLIEDLMKYEKNSYVFSIGDKLKSFAITKYIKDRKELKELLDERVVEV